MRTKEQERLHSAARYKANPELFKERARRWRIANPELARTKQRRAWEKIKSDPERYALYKARRKLERKTLKDAAFERYGGPRCACCGEDTFQFLTIDHIEGGGRQHRTRSGPDIYKTLKAEGYPDGFQVLCYNCNCAKGVYGKCPHQ